MVSPIFSRPGCPPIQSEAARTPLSELGGPYMVDVGLFPSDRHLLVVAIVRLERVLRRPPVLSDVNRATLGDFRDHISARNPAMASKLSKALDRLGKWAWMQYRYELLRCAATLREDAKRAALCR